MRPRLLRVVKDCAGAAMVEFAIVLPLLAVVLFGIVQFGLFFYDFILVENAAVLGERTLVTNRPQPSATTSCPTGYTPYTNTVNAVTTATATLYESNVTTTVAVGGSTCSSDSACSTALCTAYSQTGAYATAQTASVTVTYPCLTLLQDAWIGYNFCPGGTLSSTFNEKVN